MACCGPTIKRVDEKILFNNLRNNEEEISLTLNKNQKNEIHMNFTPEQGKWNSNYNYD